MKFCYLDETGLDQHTTVVIVVGVVVDALRMNRTKVEWGDLFMRISTLANKPVQEIHATDLIPGRGAWHGVDGNARAQIVDTVLDWFAARKHFVTFAAVDKNRYTQLTNDSRKDDLGVPWNVAAFHVVLTLQRAYQTSRNNKGHTVFIFDKGQPPDKLIELIIEPPEWSRIYYDKDEVRDPLDQVIDVPFYADSHHLPLVQIADLICYILRRFTDLADYGSQERYQGEMNRYQGWVDKIKARCIARSHRYQRSQVSDSARFFNDLAPKCLTDLH